MPRLFFKTYRGENKKYWIGMKTIPTHKKVLASLDKLFGTTPTKKQELNFPVWAYGRKWRHA